MPQPAQFRTWNFVDARGIGLKVKWDFHAGHDVLLEAKLAHEKVVDHITRMEDQPDGFACRYFQRSAHDVVFGGGVLIIQPHGVTAGIVDEPELRVAELAIRSGVPEGPG